PRQPGIWISPISTQFGSKLRRRGEEREKVTYGCSKLAGSTTKRVLGSRACNDTVVSSRTTSGRMYLCAGLRHRKLANKKAGFSACFHRGLNASMLRAGERREMRTYQYVGDCIAPRRLSQ